MLNKHDHEEKEKEKEKKKKVELEGIGGPAAQHQEENMKEKMPPPDGPSNDEDENVAYDTAMPSYAPVTDSPYYAATSSPPQQAMDEGNTAPIFHSKTNKGGKARKVSTGICDKRLNVAFDEVKQFPEAFGNITTREEVTELCAFVAPEPNESEGKKSFNFGCPFFYFPEFDGTLNYFPKGVKEYRALTPPGGNPDAAQAFASVALYCSCYQGYDLGCSNELPTTPQESDEYCEFAGVWNGDISTADVELSQTMLDCGCFWISEVTTEVGECPGVDLGYWEQNSPGSNELGMLSLIPLQ